MVGTIYNSTINITVTSPFIFYSFPSQDPSGARVRREQLLLRSDAHRVLLPHHGRTRGSGGHRRQDCGDWVLAAEAGQGQLTNGNI